MFINIKGNNWLKMMIQSQNEQTCIDLNPSCPAVLVCNCWNFRVVNWMYPFLNGPPFPGLGKPTSNRPAPFPRMASLPSVARPLVDRARLAPWAAATHKPDSYPGRTPQQLLLSPLYQPFLPKTPSTVLWVPPRKFQK